MGFHAYSSPYDWSRIAGFKATAKTVPGGMIDLSVGSPVDPVPSSVQQALVAGADAPNAHGYPVTAGTADLKASSLVNLHLGKLHNQNGILCRKPHQHHQADLEINIILQSAYHNAQIGTQSGNRQ